MSFNTADWAAFSADAILAVGEALDDVDDDVVDLFDLKH